jgi:hypothetical protein
LYITTIGQEKKEKKGKRTIKSRLYKTYTHIYIYLYHYMMASSSSPVSSPKANSPRSPRTREELDAMIEAAVDAEPNPFALPSDIDIFTMRAMEQQEKMATRERQKNMKPWERIHRSAAGASLAATIREIRSIGAKTSNDSSQRTSFTNTARREKENSKDFIAQKRNMFLMSLSLDTKRQEIKKYV